MSHSTGARLPAPALLATTALIVLSGVSSWFVPPTRTAMLLAASFVPYAWLLVAVPSVRLARHALLCAAAAGLVLVCALPVLSDDVFRFLWDGHVLRHGIDPYRFAPTDPALAWLRDAFWPRVNHPGVPTIYPPLAQALFGLVGALWYSPHALKLAMLLCHLGVAAALLRAGFVRACVWLVINPLALSESALGGHLDIAVGGALVAGVLAVERGRSLPASLWFAAASGLKMVGLLLAPLVGRKRRVAGVLALGLAALVLTPQLVPRPAQMGGASHYARRWRGNDGGFALVDASLQAALSRLAAPDERAYGHIRLPAFAGLLEHVAGTPLDPWRGVYPAGEEVPDRTDFEIEFLASLLARALVGGLLTVAVGIAWWRQTPPLRSARLLLLGALWFAPQVHPWYLLWLLPLECVAGGLAGLVWSASILAAYAPLDLWQNARVWNESGVIRIMEFAITVLVFAAEPWLLKGLPALPTSRTGPVESTGPTPR